MALAHTSGTFSSSLRISVQTSDDSTLVPIATTARVYSPTPSCCSASLLVTSASTAMVTREDTSRTRAGSRSMHSTSQPSRVSAMATDWPNLPSPSTTTGSMGSDMATPPGQPTRGLPSGRR